jgi:hypothetical protein
MGTHLEAALDTLKHNGWSAPESDHRVPSNDLLFREYIRRLHMWERLLDSPRSLWRDDLAQKIHPEIRLEENHKVILSRLLVITYSFTHRLCAYILEWANLRDHIDVVVQHQLPDPYEPLLWMFRRGGMIHDDKGYLEFWSGQEPRGARWAPSWIKQQIDTWTEIPLVELNDAILDAIDAEAKDP